MAVGDLDGDGLPDIVTGGNSQSSMVTLNRSRRGSGQADVLKLAALARPDGAPDAAHYASPVILQNQRIPITYTLYGPAAAPVGRIELEYSKDGGGRWLRAVPTTDTLTTTLAAAPFPSTTLTNTHVYTWDTFASGFFDQSDNVVLRLRAYPGTGVARNGVPDAQQWPYAVASTSPVRVRGTQIQVFDETNAISNTVAGALVYRLPADQDVGAEPLGSTPGVPFLTNARGYLQGAGELAVGDRLVALLPVGGGEGVTVYQTSAQPLPSGMAAYTVTSPGTQELVVSKDHPLLLFDLDVSLEWDARNDGTFLDDLEESLKRSSEVLYNVSNGQMALGEVRIHQNKENWLGADVVVFANSGIRPMSSMGGMVGHPTNDIGASGVITNAYLPGQIRMGPLWDPYGQSRAELTRDWQRALAHEFGHYFLFLPDNYLGYAKDGSVMSVDCAGSFMTSAYDADYSQFLNASQWQDAKRDPKLDCLKTIAANLTGRPDWKTIKAFYPMIQEGAGGPGPAVLPLNVTRVVRIEPANATRALPARNLDLRDARTNERLTVKQGQGYLIKTQGTADLHDDTLIALGPTGKSDRIKVRGAEPSGVEPSDRICVLDSGSEPPLAGCLDDMTALSGAVRLRTVPGWRPNIIVRPIEVPTGSVVITRTESISTTQQLDDNAGGVRDRNAFQASVGGHRDAACRSRAARRPECASLFDPQLAGFLLADVLTYGAAAAVEVNRSAHLQSGYHAGIPDFHRLGPCVDRRPRAGRLWTNSMLRRIADRRPAARGARRVTPVIRPPVAPERRLIINSPWGPTTDPVVLPTIARAWGPTTFQTALPIIARAWEPTTFQAALPTIARVWGPTIARAWP